jgi:hypothetical protein
MSGCSQTLGPRRGSSSLAGAAVRTVTMIALVLGAFTGTAVAQNLVQNGSFAVTGGTTSFEFSTQYSTSETVADWTSGGYNFVYLPGSTSATPGAIVMATNPTSPTGGNYIASDPEYETGAPIAQVINGLTIGKTYAVSFAWAEAQQTGFQNSIAPYWAVELCASYTTPDTCSSTAGAQDTTAVTIPTQTFSGWMYQTFDFVATSSTELLSFLSQAPSGNPPFALLTNVSMTQVPEPASVALLLSGLAGMVGLARLRGSRGGTAAA